MGILQNIANRISRAVNRRNRTEKIKRDYSSYTNQSFTFSTSDWLDLLNSHAKIAAPIDKLCEDLASAQWKLYKVVSGEEQEVFNHRFIDFMNDPNPFPEWTAGTIWEMIFKHYFLTGEGYSRLHQMGGGEYYMTFISTLDIIRLPSIDYMFYDVRMPDGGIDKVPYDEIFVMKNMNPKDPYGRGIGTIKALADDIQLSEVMAKFQMSFFRNRALPDAIISVEDATEDSLARYNEIFKEENQGGENAHNVLVTSSKVTGVILDVNMKDLDMQEGTILIRNSILEYLRIPREIMGITENSNRATAESAQYIYADGCLQPKLSKTESFINRFLIPKFERPGENLIFRYDEIVPHDNAFRHQQAIDGWSQGIMLLDEAREFDGLDPLPDGKGRIFKSDLLFKYVAEDEDFTKLETDSGFGFMSQGDEYAEKGYKAHGVDKAYINYKERLYKKNINKFSSSIYQVLQDTKKSIIDELVKTKSMKSGRKVDFDAMSRNVDADNITDTSRPIINFIDALTDWDKVADNVLPTLENLWKDVYSESKQGTTDIYKFNSTSRGFIDTTKTFKSTEVLKSIIETTKDDLKRLARDTLQESGNVDDLINKIQSDTSIFDKDRSIFIVDEQVRTAANKATHDTYKENGIRRKRWFTMGDGKVRSNHRKLNGQVKNIDERFDIPGLDKEKCPMYPRDSVLPDKEKYGCRCEILPVMDL